MTATSIELFPRMRIGRREIAAWIALLLLATLTRCVDLDSRVMSHDESIHGFLSFQLAQRGHYEQQPAYHGPLMFHAIAGSFAILGDSDRSARAPAALLSVVAFLLIWPLRRYLGPVGALCAGTLMLVSPSLLFYGRYARNDLPIVAFSLLWVWSLFQYLETRQTRWLATTVLATTLSLATKEVTFLTGAIFGLFIVSQWLGRASSLRRGDSTGGTATVGGAGDLAVTLFTLVLPFAAGSLVLMGWPALDDGSTGSLIRASASVGALVVLSSLIAIVWFGFGAGRKGRGGPGFAVWVVLASLSWAALLLLFSGLWANTRAGAINGFVGSLGYWLEQHEVGRGGQPWFYYLMLIGLYEFLPASLALLGLSQLASRRSPSGGAVVRWAWLNPSSEAGPSQRCDSSTPGTSPQVGAGVRFVCGSLASPRWRRVFAEFLVWWWFGALVGFSFAGEKMPWLIVHITLPMVLLGGWSLSLLLGRLSWRYRRGPQTLAVAALLVLVAVAISGREPFASRDAVGVAETMRFLTLALVGLAISSRLVWLWRVQRKAGDQRDDLDDPLGGGDAQVSRPQQGARGKAVWAASGVIVVLLLFTLRTALQASFVNDDLATELLVYAHSAPDVKVALRAMEDLTLRLPPGQSLDVAYESAVSWPFAWYFRDWPGARVLSEDEPRVGNADVVLSRTEPSDAVWLATRVGFSSFRHRRSWWPIEEYRAWSISDLSHRALSLQQWRAVRDIVLFRRYPGVSLADWPVREDFVLHVRKDLLDAATGVESRGPQLLASDVQLLEVQPLTAFGGPYQGRMLSKPADIAARPNGGWLIADSGNNRVLAVDAVGQLEFVIDEAFGELLEGAWGVGVSQNGDIAIADTWNGRILQATSDGLVIDQWYGPEKPDGSVSALYGPRDDVFSGGAWIVSDTGNHRLVRWVPADPSASVASFEGFREPTGLALAHEGTLLVADSWNQAIREVVLPDDSRSAEALPGLGIRRAYDRGPVRRVTESAGRNLADWPFPGWGSHDARDKPYLAVVGKDLFGTDPRSGRTFWFDSRGRLLAALRWKLDEGDGEGAQVRGTHRPVGVAASLDGLVLAVTDAEAGSIVTFDLSALRRLRLEGEAAASGEPPGVGVPE